MSNLEKAFEAGKRAGIKKAQKGWEAAPPSELSERERHVWIRGYSLGIVWKS